ncbi:MAG: hypothetical protein Q7S04_01400 [Candidatus Moranbacteria bacterium]|nr:hypothetical protein [Candidatus Moranbacteria bacterium]
MDETIQKIGIIAISVSETIIVSAEMVIDIVIVRIVTGGSPSFSAREIAKLRDVLRISIGKHADELTEEDLSEFGASMLHATALVLKVKYSQRKLPLEVR